ncbi:hypothetical protein P170DRAFT_467033 [Aspergillus steynii IBT 23096]|uniref:Uncharacterized protein n=1 Tax=Aspergillus steynii IBT 23096 TaxID=1392250 RepID=A0A2I2FYY0_9EURO|nr:uncharacterized protein P170DRAFT_467033 [Aspergillus steynii IBT 23096]PLB45828.1 hypothetical protein P170DRAFT_467033 [Aspergillus steynii IBT 23096]
MDIVEDVGSLLEEFARLKRLGQFTAAKTFFQESLAEFHASFPVALEYADLLAEQEMYEQICRLESPLGGEDFSPKDFDPADDPCTFLYRANWALIQALAAIHCQGRLKEACEKVQVFRYVFKILTQVESESNLITERDFDIWSWTHLYQMMIADGRVWDARDIIIASMRADGAAKTWLSVFGIEITSEHSFNRFLEDWKMDQYDEATCLALLDILVSACQELTSPSMSTLSDEDLVLAQRILENAGYLISRLEGNHVELVKTRSYLRFIIARTEVERKRAPQSMDIGMAKHLSMFPGLTFWTGVVPIYLPIKTENPGWIPRASTMTSSRPELETIASITHELGDYPTHILCRAELLHHCSEPGAVEQLTHMADLQICTQGDRLRYQHTCLARFLCIRALPHRQALLESLRVSQRAWCSFPGLTAWCVATVERALVLLTAAEEGSPAPLHEQGRNDDFSTSLPHDIQDRLLRNGLDRMYRLDLRKERPTSTTIITRTTTIKSALKSTPAPSDVCRCEVCSDSPAQHTCSGHHNAIEISSLDGSVSDEGSSSTSTSHDSFRTAHESDSQPSPPRRALTSVTVEDAPDTSDDEPSTIIHEN